MATANSGSTDEIGKMECFSEKFYEAATKALDAPNVVLGTIAVGGTDFIRNVKERKDIQIYEVTAQNRNELPGLIKRSDRTAFRKELMRDIGWGIE